MKIDHLIKIESKLISKETIVFLPRYTKFTTAKVKLSELIHILYIRNKFCRLPYGDNLDGCINYGKPLCPPNTPIRTDILKKYKYFLLVWVIFDFQQYKKEMREIYPIQENPYWTDKRVACLLYYQPSLRSLIWQHVSQKYEYDEIFVSGSGVSNSASMEAVGMNVFFLARKNKIPIKRNPKDKIKLFHLLVSNKSFQKPQKQLESFMR